MGCGGKDPSRRGGPDGSLRTGAGEGEKVSGRPGIVTDGPGHGWMRVHEDTYLKTVTVKMKGSKRVMVLSWGKIIAAAEKMQAVHLEHRVKPQQVRRAEITFKLI